MEWQEVCNHPSLQNLPFKVELKVELNEKGQVLMSPVKVYHSAFQDRIARLLPLVGVFLPECAIRTAKGTKVADIAWAFEERFKSIKDEAEFSIAPEICVEALLSSNIDDEIDEKIKLYIPSGAKEVWVCSASGKMTFLGKQGQLEKSILAPNFPSEIKVLS